ncbi:MAG: hypothetical protein HC904_00840 [Blastochloris sp.]|nr:hypothetical protein [Blastochloris sp.]
MRGRPGGLGIESEVGGFGLELKTEKAASWWAYPVYSNPGMDTGAGQVRQGCCLVVGWWVDLAVNGEVSQQLDLEVIGMREKRIESE